jgi:uncharacterized protein with GYD domain
VYDYMFQFNFTTDAWIDRIKNDRDDAHMLATYLKGMDGRLVDFYYSVSGIGEFTGGVALFQAPTIHTSLGVVFASMAAGEYKDVRYTRLNTLDEALETLEKAGRRELSPPGTWVLPTPKSNEPLLYHYMFQFAYTPEAWAKQIANPRNPAEELAVLAEERGGRLVNFFYTIGAYEGVAFLEASRLQTCLSIVVAASASGDYRDTRWTRFVTVTEAREAFQNARKLLAGAAVPT